MSQEERSHDVRAVLKQFLDLRVVSFTYKRDSNEMKEKQFARLTIV